MVLVQKQKKALLLSFWETNGQEDATPTFHKKHILLIFYMGAEQTQYLPSLNILRELEQTRPHIKALILNFLEWHYLAHLTFSRFWLYTLYYFLDNTKSKRPLCVVQSIAVTGQRKAELRSFK